MKRLVVIIISVLLSLTLFSCGVGGVQGITAVTDQRPDVGITVPSVTEPPVTEPPVTEPPVTEPPVTELPRTEPPVALPKLEFFLDDLSGTFEVMDSYTTSYLQGRDVGCFGIIPEVNISGKKSYRAYWNAATVEYAGLSDMRLAYVLEFELTNGELITVPITTASDTEGEFNKYLEVYIYDDVNQVEGQFYSHLLDWQMNKDTLITSVKLTGGPMVGEVGDICLTAYLYKMESQERFCITVLSIARAD